jgi:hypothetical protein
MVGIDMKNAVIGVPLVMALSGAVYAAKYYADTTYVRQDAFVASQKQQQRLQVQRLMVPLEVREKAGKITDTERALLETYRHQVEELR